MRTNEKTNRIKSINKALAIIDCFINNNKNSFTELVKLTGFGNATVARILNSLVDVDYLYKDKKTRLYYPGRKMYVLGFSVIKNLDFQKTVHPILKEIGNKTKETANAASLIGNNEFVYVDIVEGNRVIRMSAKIGDRGHLHSTSVGKILLAFMDNDKLEKVLKEINLVKKTENTITDVGSLKKELKKIVVRGYAIDDEESEIGCTCIGGPVYNNNGKVVGSISVAGPVYRIKKDIGLIIENVLESCKSASNKLGYYDYKND